MAGTIQGFLSLAPDWDGEAARPADETAVTTALELLRSIDKIAPRWQKRAQDPQVAPDPEGGVDLMYEAAGHWIMLSVRPGEANWVQVTSQRVGEETKMRRTSLAETTNEALALFEPLVVDG